MKQFLEQSRRTAVWVIAIITISVGAAMTVTWRVPTLNLAARDAYIRARGTLQPPAEVVIVAIDEASIKRFGRFPWPRSLMADALNRLSSMRTKAIALNVLYSDSTNEADDAALVGSIKRAGNIVAAAQLVVPPSRGAEWLRPLPAIEQAAAGTGHGNVLTDFDGVARSMTLRESDDEGNAYWTMAVELVRVGERVRMEEIRDVPQAVMIGSRMIPIEADSPAVTFSIGEQKNLPQTFRASRMTIDFIGPAGAFATSTISFADVIDGRFDPEKIDGRYVLIGATAAAMGDRVASPFGRFTSGEGDQNGTLMPGVEVLANAVTTILRARFQREAPDWVAALCAAMVAATVLIALSLAQGSHELFRQTVALFGLMGLILGLSYLAFVRWMVAPPLVPAIISLVTAAPLGFLLRSLAVSASLDERITEMTLESARLSPLAPPAPSVPAPSVNDRMAIAEKRSWWPRGTTQKAHALAGLQTRLLARTQFVDRALQSVEDGLLIADITGRIAFANPRAAAILGLSESALLGSNLFYRLSEAEYSADKSNGDWPDDDWANRDWANRDWASRDWANHDWANREWLDRVQKETLTRLLEDRVVVEREIVTVSGESRYYILRMAAVNDGQTRAPLGIVATLSDITRQRELQQMQTDVIRLVTHEMKTPLTAIKGMSEVLMKFESAADKRREMHATIHEAAGRLTRMIDDYLDLTTLESGARAPRLQFHRLESLIEQTLLLLDPVAAERGIRLLRKFAAELPAVLVDCDLLSRALTNLVANAIKYSPIDTEVTISVKAGDGNMFIAVADQGQGIPPEHRVHIFEKFFRVPRVEDADTPGTGLGLALVREIAELHGGRVTVESEASAGSTFTLRLPLKRSGAKIAENQPRPTPNHPLL